MTDATQPLTFTFAGRTIPAIHGQSIAAALYVQGRRVFSRSFKYHRPRGLFCVAGDCPNCLMQVDGRPNVRTCIEPARQGQVVHFQHAWPALDFDVLRLFDKLDRFLPVGFYYKRFHKPRWLWPIFEQVVRRLAGLGRIDVHARPNLDTAVEHLHAEVCVVGGGPAGLAAAQAAADAGADVLLLERQPALGGRLLWEDGIPPQPLSQGDKGAIRTRLGSAVFGLYEGNLLGAFQGERLLKIRARQIIVCTGSRQTPVPFHNNDLPGIMAYDGVLRLARLYGVRAGQRAVVLCAPSAASFLTEQLRILGIEVVACIPATARLPLIQANGNKYLKAVRITELNDQGQPTTSVKEHACDLFCLATDPVPANELLLQGGLRFQCQDGRWQPVGRVPGLLAAGGAAGIVDLDAQVASGRRSGKEAAALLGYPVPELSEVDGPSSIAPWQSALYTSAVAQPGKRFVCLCEDVTVKDIDQAVAEGFDNIETLKRYSTAGMGPCQGKMCAATVSALCARATGQEINAIGTTTSRPPAVPVPLAVLAAERRHHPVRRTPLHHWHQAAGARWLDAGQWKRPESYGDPVAEVRAVRSQAGLIDVSTLGKLEVSGPDAATLLERVYLNRWADLGIGKVRYGVMCTEEGILFDDGIGARLGPDRFYLTTTTGNAEAVLQWLELWRTTWRLDVTVQNRTSALAALNLAGPQARAVLASLTTLDLAPTAFPYLTTQEAELAGVPCRLLRIGFVGELGYEIHCASCHAWHLWEALMQAGAAFGLQPFGVEAQRILRLEKGHLIVGQDTDALSDPFGAGLERMVHLDKPQFHGRAALLRRQEMGVRSRLVGFHLSEGVAPKGDNTWARHLEGCQVVEQGRPVGRVTSSRYSPILERYLGLAWLPAARASEGERFLIHHGAADLPATVALLPFYDPQGKQLKS